jgi:anti-sigma B factor antagonist
VSTQSYPQILHTQSEDIPSGSILHVIGELDLASAPYLRAMLVRLIDRGRSVIVDCSELQYLDMAGIHVLEDSHRQAADRGQRLVLVGSVPLVHKILAIIGLNERMPVVDTIAEALELLGQEVACAGNGMTK